MRNIKAFLAGFFYIVILGLVIQLIFMFIAMGYTELIRAYPWISLFGGYIGYAAGICVYFMLMASGGLLTAAIAQKHITAHCCVVGCSTTLLSVLSSQNNDELTYLSVVFVLSGIIFTIIGGEYWKRNNQVTTGAALPQ